MHSSESFSGTSHGAHLILLGYSNYSSNGNCTLDLRIFWTQVETAQVPLQLVSLPVELLTEVLKSLTWKDILRLRVVRSAFSLL